MIVYADGAVQPCKAIHACSFCSVFPLTHSYFPPLSNFLPHNKLLFVHSGREGDKETRNKGVGDIVLLYAHGEPWPPLFSVNKACWEMTKEHYKLHGGRDCLLSHWLDKCPWCRQRRPSGLCHEAQWRGWEESSISIITVNDS